MASTGRSSWAARLLRSLASVVPGDGDAAELLREDDILSLVQRATKLSSLLDEGGPTRQRPTA